MRRKNMEGSNKDALVVRGRPIDREKGKFSSIKSNSKGRSKSPVHSVWISWKCSKAGHYKNDYKSKKTEGSAGFDEK